jgi:hypothetical protein
MPDSIVNSVQEIAVSSDATLSGELLEKLKDIDANRIAKTDEVVMRKAVLGLLTVISSLEGRIAVLESLLGRSE